MSERGEANPELQSSSVVNAFLGRLEPFPTKHENVHSLFYFTNRISQRKEIQFRRQIDERDPVYITWYREETRRFGRTVGVARKLRIHEVEGHDVEGRMAKFQTTFEIDLDTMELEVGQHRISHTLSDEYLQGYYPNYGIDQKTSEEQWAYLAQVAKESLDNHRRA